MWFQLAKEDQADALASAVNTAIGLPEDHDFGLRFIDDYVFAKILPRDTTHRAISAWLRQNKFMERTDDDNPKTFTYLDHQHSTLVGLLKVFSIMMGESLIKNFDIPIP